MACHKFIDELVLKDYLSLGVIVEIGSARDGNGLDSSTKYFDEIAKKYDTEFWSVDLSEEANYLANKIIGSNAILSDGEIFLSNFSNYTDKNISILYLDNFDIIYNEKHKQGLLKRVGSFYNKNYDGLNNETSAKVHLAQLKSSISYLASKHVIIIDDTKKREKNVWWGKGALAVPYLLEKKYKILKSNNDGVMLTVNEK